MFTRALPDLEATMHFGRQLGERLFPGAIVALMGPLGAGKTHLVRAIAEGLGIADGRLVTSPTFGLIHEYPACLPIYHFDAYRLRSPEEFIDLGSLEYFESQGVCLIEWAERVARCLPPEHLRIELTPTGKTSRQAMMEAWGERYERLLEGLGS